MNDLANISFTYHPLTDENIDSLVILFEVVYGKILSLEDVEKKYPFNGTTVKGYGIFANYNDVPIGFVGATDYEYVSEGETCRLAQIFDVMVDPEYRGRDLYITMLEQLSDWMKQRGVTVALCLPNDSSIHPMEKKSGWKVIRQMKGFTIHTGSLPVRIVLKKIGLNNLYLKWARKKLKSCLVSFDPARFNYSTGVVYNQEFYEYKNTHSHFVMNLNGVHVWCKLDGALTVGLISNVVDEQLLLNTIDALKIWAKKLFLPKIIVQFTEGTEQEMICTKNYPSFDSWKIFFKSFDPSKDETNFIVQYCDIDSF